VIRHRPAKARPDRHDPNPPAIRTPGWTAVHAATAFSNRHRDHRARRRHQPRLQQPSPAGGRPAASDYDAFIGAACTAFAGRAHPAANATAKQVAEVIFAAATHGTDELRYVAIRIKLSAAARRETSEAAYIAFMRQQVAPDLPTSPFPRRRPTRRPSMTTIPSPKTIHTREHLGTPTDLSPDAIHDLSAALQALLADVFALYLKTKNFHWHMSGRHFRDYHLLLDEQGDQLFAMTDPIAERARKIGGTTLRSIGHIARQQRILDNDAEYVDPMDMLAELRDDNRHLVSILRETHHVAETHGDVATTSLLEVWLDETERRVWFLFESTRHTPGAND
jgi:starvation-inducible DNA-binding protein